MKLINKIHSKYITAGVIAVMAADAVFAQTGDLASSASAIGTGLGAVKTMLPIGAQVIGFIIAGGGLFQIHKHQKSQGRDGSIGGGIAGVAIGVCLFALGGFMSWTGTSIGVGASNVALPG